MVFVEGDRYKIDVTGKEYFLHLKKYTVAKKGSFWWAEAEEGVVIPGWPKSASGKSGRFLGMKDDEVEEQLKQNGLVLVVSEWKGGVRKSSSRKRRTRHKRRVRQTRRK